MKKSDLTKAVSETKDQTRAALQAMYDALNQGQQKKIVENDEIKALFDRYDVKYTE